MGPLKDHGTYDQILLAPDFVNLATWVWNILSPIYTRAYHLYNAEIKKVFN